ncbi:hypothetical protein BGX28_008342 [Mortierella sp. GBA30]|nr:hypothetical protein BGX28_008342 [Mortierella sp. GBA30]
MYVSIVAIIAATVAAANAQSTSNVTAPTSTVAGAPTNTASSAPSSVPSNAFDPSFPFQPNGPCVENCLVTIGKKMYADYTTDPKSPNFLKSLSYETTRGTIDYMQFMKDAGMCMVACSAAEQDLYKKQFQAKVDWYQAAKTAADKNKPASGARSLSASGLVGAAALLSAVALF